MTRAAGAAPSGTPFPFKVVLSDIDGTLLDAGRRVSPRTAGAVRRLCASGVAFALVTGRMPGGIAEVRRELGVAVHAVCYSGALVLDPDDAAVASTCLEAGEAAGVLAVVRGEFPQFEPCYFSGLDWFVADAAHPAVVREASIVRSEPREADLDALLGAGRLPNKLFCNCTYDIPAGAALADRLRNRFPELTVIRSTSGSMVEVLPAGVDKACGALRLLDALGLRAADALAFGDDANDVALLRAVGRGVAPWATRRRRRWRRRTTWLPPASTTGWPAIWNACGTRPPPPVGRKVRRLVIKKTAGTRPRRTVGSPRFEAARFRKPGRSRRRCGRFPYASEPGASAVGCSAGSAGAGETTFIGTGSAAPAPLA